MASINTSQAGSAQLVGKWDFHEPSLSSISRRSVTVFNGSHP